MDDVAPASLAGAGPEALHELLDERRLAALGVDLDAVALTDGTESLTWRELVDVVAGLAAGLAELGVAVGDRVGVHLRKSVWSFVTVHATLRCGGVMVPLDPFAPVEATVTVLAEAEPAVLVTDAPDATVDALVAARAPIGVIRRPAAGPADGRDEQRPVPERWWDDAVATPPRAPADVRSDAAAYIIFTSGSTGRPKGIVHTHGSALAYARRAVATYGIGPDDVLANIAALHFDQSTFELYAGPLAGSSVVVVPDLVLRFPASVADLLERTGVTVIYTVPFVLRQLVERGGLAERDLGRVRWVKYGGEVFPPSDVAALMAAVPSASVSNVYGPAEVNQCTHHHVTAPPAGTVPIGRPWPGVDVRVCDETGEEVPAGSDGELWVSGPTTMRGYWRRDDLTRAAFVEADGRRWYRTGDLVRWHGDELEFVGRGDHQVKVRGQRVELEAVEAAIADLPGVVEVGVVALVGTDGATELVAVVVAPPDTDVAALRHDLARRLAPAAVPARFERVERLDRTANGKIDRASVAESLLNGG